MKTFTVDIELFIFRLVTVSEHCIADCFGLQPGKLRRYEISREDVPLQTLNRSQGVDSAHALKPYRSDPFQI